MVSKITEIYDLCPEMGGIQVDMDCFSAPIGIISRSGSPKLYNLTLASTGSDGSYTFDIPAAVFSYPIGYYDLSIYDGKLLKKVIRLNLHTTGLAHHSSVVESNCIGPRAVAPNIELVVECMCPQHGIANCCPEECEDATLVIVNAGSFSMMESIPTSEEVYALMEGVITSGNCSTIKTVSGGPSECQAQLSLGTPREVIGDMAAARNQAEFAQAMVVQAAINPTPAPAPNEPVPATPSLADMLNNQFMNGEL